MKNELIKGVQEIAALCGECIEELGKSGISTRTMDILASLIPDKSGKLFDMICDVEKPLQQKGKWRAAHTLQETEASGCAFDKDRKRQKVATCNNPQKPSQSQFEKFCVKHGIDPLTADKSSLVRVGGMYLRYVNQYRSRLGGRKISQSQGREAVLNYILMR